LEVTDAMVRAALGVLERHGWEMDEELAAEVREAIEAALAAAGPKRRPHRKREAALRSRAEWAEKAREAEKKAQARNLG
jgi:cobalamin biosynthesis Mg chelatase CobN